MLGDWTNEGYDPFAAPVETGAPGPQARREHAEPSSARASPPSAWWACPATCRCAPTCGHRSTARSPTCRRTSRWSTPSPASRRQSAPSTCSPISRARTSPGTRPSHGGPREPLLSDHRGVHPAGLHGNDRVEWFIQLTDEIVWDVADKKTGEPRARVTMRAGDVAACRPTSAIRAIRPSARCCWCGRTSRPGSRARTAGRRRSARPVLGRPSVAAGAGQRRPEYIQEPS